MPDTLATRFSISLSPELLERLDGMIARRKLPSRSQAIAEMINQELSEHDCNRGRAIVAGTLTLIYGHRREAIRNQLAKIQSRYVKEIISSQHVFLEDDHSLEVLLVQGPSDRLNELADRLRGVRGVEQVKVALTARVLPPLH